MKKIILFLGLVLLSTAIPVEGTDGEKGGPGVKTIPISDSIYVLQGKGGNIGVSVGEDGVLVVDGDYQEMITDIQAAIDALSESPIKFLINTHWHGDHTGGNEALGQEAMIVAHKNVRRRLSTRQVVELFNMVSEPKAKSGLPVITFDESVTLHFNNEEIDVIHYANAHTDGDGVVFFKGSNVVHLGDLFFNGMYPFIDLGSGGDVEGYMNTVESLIKRIPSDAVIIPGHGPVADLEDLKAFHRMLMDVTTIVKGYIQAGKSLEEVHKADLPKEITSVWGKGFLSTDVWLSIVYDSYKK